MVSNIDMNSVKTKKLQLEQLIPIWKERLKAGQSVRFSPKGISMLPLLRQGRDSVLLSFPPEKLKKHDIVLYQRENGMYVLHRIIEVQEDGRVYTCIGDNQFVKEPGLCREQMIAVVTAFTRGKREHSVKEPVYRMYCSLWHGSRPLRYFVFRVVRKLRTIARRWKIRGDVN